MKIVIARLNHETNTFSPVPTPLSAFGAGDPHGPAFGADAYAADMVGVEFLDFQRARARAIVRAGAVNDSACGDVWHG